MNRLAKFISEDSRVAIVPPVRIQIGDVERRALCRISFVNPPRHGNGSHRVVIPVDEGSALHKQLLGCDDTLRELVEGALAAGPYPYPYQSLVHRKEGARGGRVYMSVAVRIPGDAHIAVTSVAAPPDEGEDVPGYITPIDGVTITPKQSIACKVEVHCVHLNYDKGVAVPYLAAKSIVLDEEDCLSLIHRAPHGATRGRRASGVVEVSQLRFESSGSNTTT